MILSVAKAAIAPELLEDYLRCAIGPTDGVSLSIDADSDCYRAIVTRLKALKLAALSARLTAPAPIAPPRGAAKSRGLGDTIAKLTASIGIESCGDCKKRQALLNELVPYSDAALTDANDDSRRRRRQ